MRLNNLLRVTSCERESKKQEISLAEQLQQTPVQVGDHARLGALRKSVLHVLARRIGAVMDDARSIGALSSVGTVGLDLYAEKVGLRGSE